MRQRSGQQEDQGCGQTQANERWPVTSFWPSRSRAQAFVARLGRLRFLPSCFIVGHRLFTEQRFTQAVQRDWPGMLAVGNPAFRTA